MRLFTFCRRHPVLWFIVPVLAVALIVGWGFAVRVTDSAAPEPFNHTLLLQPATVTPTVGFGPIITAPPASTSAPGDTTPPAPTITPTTPPTTSSPTPGITLTPTIVGTPLPHYQAAVMGIQIDPNQSLEDFNTMLWLAQRLGVQWVKFQFAWNLLEPQPGVLSQDVFYKYRLYVQDAKQKEFKVMISIAKAPDWARSSLDEAGPPRDPQDLANFITQMMSEIRVDLYGNSYFDAIEIWNEPNLRREWNGETLGGAEYMQLFDTVYHAIRAGEGGHSVTVITAGLAPTGINDGVAAIDDRAFLRQMYAAGLNNPAYQNVAIGIHPYGAANPPDARWCGQDTCSERGYDNHPSWFFMNTLEDYHAIMQEYQDTSHSLWVTEFGWGTYDGFLTSDGQPAASPVDPPYFQWIDQTDQANYILRAFEIGQELPYVDTMILWNLNFSTQALIDNRDPRAAYALLRGGESPLRPAFDLLEAALHQ